MPASPGKLAPVEGPASATLLPGAAPCPAGRTGVQRRGRAESLARRVLLIREPEGQADVHNIFSSSIALSATRCLLSYVILPMLGLGALPVVGSAIGIPVGLVALVFDVRAIRRFFVTGHRWRWVAMALYVVIMAMVASLVGWDVSRLA